jgi:hypothetical protein
MISPSLIEYDYWKEVMEFYQALWNRGKQSELYSLW